MSMSVKLFETPLCEDMMVASSFENGEVFLWNLKTGTIFAHHKLHNEPGSAVLCFA
jgi:hypothetical protein